MKIDKYAYGEDYNKDRNDNIVKIASVAICLLIIFVIGILAWAHFTKIFFPADLKSYL